MAKAKLLMVLLLLLLLAAGLSLSSEPPESGTFNASNIVVCRLNNGPSESGDNVTSLELEFRTSHANSSTLLDLRNTALEHLTIVLASKDRIVAQLAWLPGDGDEVNEGSSLAAAFNLATENVSMDAVGVSNGEWHRMSIRLGNSSGSVHLDGRQLASLPAEFSAVARFPWGNATTQAALGSSWGGFRGCLANASLDGAVQLPLHAQSSLINGTDGYYTVDRAASNLPDGGPGCRQDPCPCLPNGACVYLQWNVFQECNCTRGFEGSLCQSEWHTCRHVESGQVCLNGGSCSNLPGVDAYKCTCTPAGSYLGSRCQSFNHCQSPITCQNGGNCSLSGNPEVPSELDYKCACTDGFIGRNCTEPTATQPPPPPPPQPDTGLIVGISIGLIAVLLILVASLVAVKVVRDRRRDAGAYKPSQREANSTISVYADPDSMGMGPVMRPPQEERFI